MNDGLHGLILERWFAWIDYWYDDFDLFCWCLGICSLIGREAFRLLTSIPLYFVDVRLWRERL